MVRDRTNKLWFLKDVRLVRETEQKQGRENELETCWQERGDSGLKVKFLDQNRCSEKAVFKLGSEGVRN